MTIKQKILNKILYWNTNAIIKSSSYKLLYKTLCSLFLTPKDFSQIPIIVNNRNRYTYLKELIEWLEANNFKNYYIIDNNSTYKPLLEYYQTIKGRVFFLENNAGHLSFWNQGINLKFLGTYYVYTDSDILPILERNPNLLFQYFKALNKYKFAEKVGSALKIDDLPDTYKLKNKVIDHESKFWKHQIDNNAFLAGVDTTIAMYLPNFYGRGTFINHVRLSGDCLVRHLPWYINSEELDTEEQYYIKESTTATHWTKFDSNKVWE